MQTASTDEMRYSRAAFILFHLQKELIFFSSYRSQTREECSNSYGLCAMAYGLWTRTGCRGADEAKPQHEESEGLEEDVQVAVPGSEHGIV
jgi:hypothetical protein